MRRFTFSLSLGLALVPFSVCLAGPTDTVSTGGSFTATYGTASQASPRIPWSDLGFQATASATQGTLSGTVGGNTQYALTSAITSGQIFTPGSTSVSLGYTPGWTGSLSSSASGTLGLNFGYSIGPFNGSAPLLTDSMTTGVSGLDLSGALNSGSGLSNSTTTPGLGISGGFGVKAQAGICPFCGTVASASVGFHVGTQVSQSLDVTPTVTYGDLVWYTNDTTSVSTPQVDVMGGGGSVDNLFAPNPMALGLAAGSNTIDMNILPFAALSLGVGNEAIVSIPASISYSYDVFGVSGSGSASGNLYALSTGLQSLTASGTWYAPTAYSIELDASCSNLDSALAVLTCDYQAGGFDTTVVPPPIGITFGSTPPGSPTGGGPSSGFPPLGPLVPGDAGCVPGTVCEPPCDPATGQCISQVNLTASVPEPDALWLLAAGVLMLGLSRGRRGARAALQ